MSGDTVNRQSEFFQENNQSYPLSLLSCQKKFQNIQKKFNLNLLPSLKYIVVVGTFVIGVFLNDGHVTFDM